MAIPPDTWELVQTWQYVLPPSRPDYQDLKVISDRLAGMDRAGEVGVLGSTPEFRDLLHDLGFQSVVVLERNARFLEAMSRLRVHTNHESVILGNWLETLPACDQRFTALLSDLTAGNIPYSDRRHYYDLIAAALKPGGVFIDKHLTNPSGLISMDTIRAKYADMPINLQSINYFSCEAIFCSQLQFEAGLIDTSWIYDQLSSDLTGPRFQRLLTDCQLVTPRDCIWYYGKEWSELESDYCSFLDLVHRHDLNPAQPYFGRAHQYIFERR